MSSPTCGILVPEADVCRRGRQAIATLLDGPFAPRGAGAARARAGRTLRDGRGLRPSTSSFLSRGDLAAVNGRGSRRMRQPLRVGVVCDLAEEQWPSMDLVADMLVERLGRQGRDVEAVRLQRAVPPPRHGGPARRPRAGRLHARSVHEPAGRLPAVAARDARRAAISFTSSTTATRIWRTSCRRSGPLSPATTSIRSAACSTHRSSGGRRRFAG